MTSHATQSGCPQCDRSLVPEALFCHHCGRQVQLRCPSCGSMNPGNSSFCFRCGTRLAGSQQGTLDGLGMLPPPAAAGQVPIQIACPRCHAANDAGSRFCYSCGLPFEGQQAAPIGETLDTPLGQSIGTPAGFWVRTGAWLIDYVIIVVVDRLVATAMGQEAVPGAVLMGRDVWRIVDWFSLDSSSVVTLLLEAAYYTVAVATFCATIGKKAFGLSVVRSDGSKVGPGRALARYLLSFLSGLLLCVGYLMVAFRTDKRALHDLIADTYVVRR